MGVHMAVLDAGCGVRGGGSHGSRNRLLLVVWDSGVLMAVSHAGCGGEVGVLMAVSDAGFGGGREGGFHGRPIGWLFGGLGGMSWQSEMLVVYGRGGVLMAVSIPFGMGNGIQGFSWQPQMLVVGGRGPRSHSYFTRWLWGMVSWK